MSDSIYITTTEAYSGKSLVSLGIAELLLRRTHRIAIFRPVIEARRGEYRDKNIDLLLSYTGTKQQYADTFAFSRREAGEFLVSGRYEEMVDRIIEKYKELEESFDFILIIGSDLTGAGAALEFDMNADIAQNLGSPVLIVSSGMDRDVETAVNVIKATHDAYVERGCQVLGAIINRTEPERVAELRQALEEALSEQLDVLAVIPAHPVLSSPTMREIADHLGAEVLYGGSLMDRLAYRYLVIAMQIPNYLGYLTENALLITPGDRSGVILSALQAHQSQMYPPIAGLVLTGGLTPEPPVARLLQGLPELVPILSVPSDTFQTATNISNVRSYITTDNQVKIPLSWQLFEEHVDTETLMAEISSIQPRGITPKLFIYSLQQKAKADKKHIVLPEGTDLRILQAAGVLLRRNLVDLTLIGDEKEIRKLVNRNSIEVDLSHLKIIEPRESPHFDDYAQTLHELRKHKGVNLDFARDLMCDVSYFGTMMVYKGHADGMVSGAAHTTQHTIRPALQFIKTKPGFSVVSSVFFMLLRDRVLVYGDCAVNPNPSAEELAEIAISSADTAAAFGIEPRVALLSYSSGTSGEGEDVERVRMATQLARERRPDLKLEGPLQYDAAVAMDVAAMKMPGSEVAGQATVFIFPDLNTGNNTYKAVQRETGAIAVGPVLQGLKKPVNDLSRGCTVDDVINTVVITAIQAQTA